MQDLRHATCDPLLGIQLLKGGSPRRRITCPGNLGRLFFVVMSSVVAVLYSLIFCGASWDSSASTQHWTHLEAALVTRGPLRNSFPHAHRRNTRNVLANQGPAGHRPEERPLPPFATDLVLPSAMLQDSLRADIMRRCTELKLLGWLGRAYLALPRVFDRFFPTVFRFAAYDMQAAACYEQPGLVDCTFKEGSVGGIKGIPFRLKLNATLEKESRIMAVRLLGIGCDLVREDGARAARENGAVRISQQRAEMLLHAINDDRATKRMVVEAVTHAIFSKVSKAADAAKQGIDLVACSAEPISFVPREELYALEGTSYKWVQQVSGYYFAKSRLQDVCFESLAQDMRFTFYFDPSEPFNSDNVSRIVNPEVINCMFGDS